MDHAIALHNSALDKAVEGFFSFWAAFVTKSKKAFLSMQRARLIDAMNQMTNDQLAQVGITRREIPDYAHMIIRANS